MIIIYLLFMAISIHAAQYIFVSYATTHVYNYTLPIIPLLSSLCLSFIIMIFSL